MFRVKICLISAAVGAFIPAEPKPVQKIEYYTQKELLAKKFKKVNPTKIKRCTKCEEIKNQHKVGNQY